MPDDPPASPDALALDLLEQVNLGRSYDELFELLYERLRGVVPYHRIAVALLQEPGDHLILVSCRSDGPVTLHVGYAAPLAGNVRELENLVERATIVTIGALTEGR